MGEGKRREEQEVIVGSGWIVCDTYYIDKEKSQFLFHFYF